ncbi:MAG: YbhB/YbcL family Raf kinase inhibitor-like protein [Gemmatimonadaceae bacterium]
MSFKLTSSEFTEGGSIPPRYTCEGDDISPPLEWSGAPDGTRSFVLIVDDPDAPDPAHPQRTYVHWVLYNIPAGVVELHENASAKGLPDGAAQGSNDWENASFGGPCPPIGRHRYFFKLYALATELNGLTNPTKADVEQAMEGHVLAKAQLVSTYEKSKK